MRSILIDKIDPPLGIGIVHTMLGVLAFFLLGLSPRSALVGALDLMRSGAACLWEIRLTELPAFGMPRLAWPLRRRQKLAESHPAFPRIVSAKIDESVAEATCTGETWSLPSLDIFDRPSLRVGAVGKCQGEKLISVLAEHGVAVSFAGRRSGPVLTRYEVAPSKGVKVGSIVKLAPEIALALGVESVQIAPVIGASKIGIEVPISGPRQVVSMRQVLEAAPSRQGATLPIALGAEATGELLVADLARLPHLLLAGTTGSGKSVALNGIIASLITTQDPTKLRLLMVDPKRVELAAYKNLPHLLCPPVSDMTQAAGALAEFAAEVDRRYVVFEKVGVRELVAFNAKHKSDALPRLVLVIDELADLMLTHKKSVEPLLVHIAQVGRAAGCHIVAATQKPLAAVISSLLKSNCPARLAFSVATRGDSEVILDGPGAETLQGSGDALFQPVDASKPIRVQGAFCSTAETNRLVKHWTSQVKLVKPRVTEPPHKPGASSEEARLIHTVPAPEQIQPPHQPPPPRYKDPLTLEVKRFVVQAQACSMARIRAKFSIGDPRARAIIEELAELSVLGPKTARGRAVLLPRSEAS